MPWSRNRTEERLALIDSSAFLAEDVLAKVCAVRADVDIARSFDHRADFSRGLPAERAGGNFSSSESATSTATATSTAAGGRGIDRMRRTGWTGLQVARVGVFAIPRNRWRGSGPRLRGGDWRHGIFGLVGRRQTAMHAISRNEGAKSAEPRCFDYIGVRWPRLHSIHHDLSCGQNSTGKHGSARREGHQLAR